MPESEGTATTEPAPPGPMDAVVVGAGISGLACAERLRRAGASVRVLEASEEVGGKLSSTRSREGYLLEAGPHEVRSGDPAMFRQFRELGIEDRRVRARSAVRKRYVVKGGEPVPIPTSPLGLLGTDLLSARGKLRLLGEPFVPVGNGRDESVEGFFSRRLGREVAEGPVDAFVSGVYAGNARDLSMRAVFPSLLDGERSHGSLLRWAVSRAWGSGGDDDGRSSELFSFRDGLQAWPEALAEAVGPDRLRTSSPVSSVRSEGEGWSVRFEGAAGREELRARHLVLAVPAPEAARLLGELEPELARSLGDVSYAPVSVVHLGYPEEQIEHPLDGFGVLAPSREGRDVLGILWVSSLFEDRAPPGVALTASFVGGARRPELAREEDAALLERVQAEHRDLLGASGSPSFRHVHRWERALPQYDRAQPEAAGAADEAERRRDGLHLTGNYRAGIGIPAAWSDGRRAAADVLEGLESGAAPRSGRPVGAAPA